MQNNILVDNIVLNKEKELIEKALTLAQRTPSACNRQGWFTHVFMGDYSVKLIKWQGGSTGFEDEISQTLRR